MDREKLVEVRDLRISATNDDGDIIPIVKGVSFNIHKGEVVALIGESGSGKTTISLASLAYTKPGLHFAGGELLIGGEDMLQAEPLRTRDIRGSKVAYLAQSAAATFNPAITIGEQVTESAVLHGILTQEQANKRAVELYRALELPDPDRIGIRYPHQVSGGQLQRLMAAMALCGKPDLMVLDEPTTALDVTTQIEVLKAFKKVIHEEDSAAIYVTHDLAVVAQIADYIVVLYGGEVMEQGTSDQIINNPTHAYTQRLMAAVRPKPQAGLGTAVGAEHEREIPAIKVRDMTAGYGGIVNGEPKVPILRDINVEVKNGHVVGVIGESGCGKSTLARVMAGLLPQARGSIKLDDEELEGDLRDRRLEQLQKIQFVFQMADTALNPKQVIGDIIGRPVSVHRGASAARAAERCRELLGLVDLPAEFERRYPGQLSGGQKQRVCIARALAAEPDLVLCDEVTSALDPLVADGILELLKRLQREVGVSFVFITHDMAMVRSIADEITVLGNGRVMEEGARDEVLGAPRSEYTATLIESTPEMETGWLDRVLAGRARRSPRRR